MPSHHIRHGVDLGTTNSAIALVDRGIVRILKNDFQHDTMPSAVVYSSRGVRVGQRPRNQWFRQELKNVGNEYPEDAFLEFKRTMGTDHRYQPSSRPDIAALSEDLSAEVLRELLRFAELRDGQAPQAAVVTIPAAFSVNQQQATQKAAERAGLAQCRLLLEPVAAAMAFGLEAESGRDAKWLVFDFGGGTFDAALVLCEEGQITIKDTEGDNRLGGKDLDLAIVVRFLWPEINEQVSVENLSEEDNKHLRNGLRQFAERALIDLSTKDSAYVESDVGLTLGNGEEIDLDLELSRDDARSIVAPYIQRAIDKATLLLQRHGLRGDDLDELVLVGGPTHSAILRSMVAEQLRVPNTSVDPMTAVAQGAALYASTVALDQNIVARSREQAGEDVLPLLVEHETTSVNDEEFVTVRYQDPEDVNRFGPIEMELRREGWASAWMKLEPEGTLFEIKLERGPNTFALSARATKGVRIATDPSEFTIVQGVKLTGSPLNHDLGMAAWNEDRTRRIFRKLEGADKNRPLPVTGVTTLRTTAAMRPGSENRLRLAIWEADGESDGKRLSYCGKQIMTIELRGYDLEQLVPEGSRFRLSITTKESSAAPARATIFFEDLDDEYELEIPAEHDSLPREWVKEEIETARRELKQLLRKDGETGKLREIENNLNSGTERFREAADRGDTDGGLQAVDRIKETLRALYDIVDAGEWERLEADLDTVWKDLALGRDESNDPELAELGSSLEEVKNRRDLGLGRELVETMRSLHYERNRREITAGFLMWAKQGFGRIRWTNAAQAREAVDVGAEAVIAGADENELGRHVRRIWELQADRPARFDPKDLPQV